MSRLRLVASVMFVVHSSACAPAGRSEPLEAVRLARDLGLDAGDTAKVVLILNANMCFSCDPALAPYLDVVRKHQPGVAIWLWEEPTSEERVRLAAERIRIVGVVPSRLRPSRREALALRVRANGTVHSGTAAEVSRDWGKE